MTFGFFLQSLCLLSSSTSKAVWHGEQCYLPHQGSAGPLSCAQSIQIPPPIVLEVCAVSPALPRLSACLLVPGNSRACVAWHCAGPLHLRENAAAPVSCAGRLEILPLDIMRARVCRVLCFCARQGCSSAIRPSWHIWRPPSERAPGGAGGASEQQKVCACMRARDVSPVTEGEERVLWLLSAPERPCGCGWGHFSDSRPRCACNWVASVPNT